MKYLYKIIISLSLLIFAACSSGFNSKKAHTLLEKENLTTEDYSDLLEIYENGVDDAIKFSQDNSKELTSDQKEEMVLIFAIGMRLSKDDIKLTEEQRKEFERINLKGTEEAPE